MTFSFRSLRLLGLLAAGAVLFNLGGCAATAVALAHKDLTVTSAMSKTIFLPMTSQKTFALAVRNSAGTSVDSALIQNNIIAGLQAKGYTMVPPDQAQYQVQLNIVSMTVDGQSAGSNDRGFAAGMLAGGSNGNMQGALIGGLVGGIADTVAGALVKNVTAMMTAQLQIASRSGAVVSTTVNVGNAQGTTGSETQHLAQTSDRVDYRTRIEVWANQVNLKVQDAIPQIQNQLVRNVVGLF